MSTIPLTLEEREHGQQKVFEFSFGGSHCWAPALAKDMQMEKRAKVLKVVFQHIDELAHKHDVVRVAFKLSPLSASFGANGLSFISDLLRFGYADVSLATQIVDLSLSEKQLLGAMSKGHRADIMRGRKSLTVHVFDRNRIEAETFEKYRLMHHKAAGRITRPRITFKMMYDWIAQGNAVLLGAETGGEFVGFLYALLYKEGAYYASGANDPDRTREPIGHALQWQAIQWLKDHGYRYYEIGMQQFGVQPYDFPSEKDLNIARFKRGFGGLTLPLLIKEKYYSSEFYQRVNAERVERYSETLCRSPHVREN